MKDDFSNVADEIKNALMITILDTMFGIGDRLSVVRSKARVIESLRKASSIFSKISVPGIVASWMKGVSDAVSSLKRQGMDIHPKADRKAVEILAKDMIRDFEVASSSGEKILVNFFHFSKQGVLTESEISNLIGTSIAKTANSESAVLDVARALRKKLSSSKIAQLSAEEERNLISLAMRKYRNAGVPKQFLSSFEKMIREDKFLRLINKNGNPMFFRVSTYAELLVRTRFAEAQTAGTIEQAKQFGVTEFRVSSHNTTCDICGQHENMIYTIDRENTRFPYLSAENRPPYHPHCKHRLNAVPVAMAKAA